MLKYYRICLSANVAVSLFLPDLAEFIVQPALAFLPLEFLGWFSQYDVAEFRCVRAPVFGNNEVSAGELGIINEHVDFLLPAVPIRRSIYDWFIAAVLVE